MNFKHGALKNATNQPKSAVQLGYSDSDVQRGEDLMANHMTECSVHLVSEKILMKEKGRDTV